MTDEVIYDHLAGTITVGIYPLLPDNNCHFLAVDFDQAEWAADVNAFAEACRNVNVPVALEVSRSGAHAWIFFTDAVPSRDARQLVDCK